MQYSRYTVANAYQLEPDISYINQDYHDNKNEAMETIE